MKNSVPNTLVELASAGLIARRRHTFQLMSLRNSSFGPHPGQVDLHPLLVDHAAAVGQLRVLRPRDDVLVAPLDHPRRAPATRARS